MAKDCSPIFRHSVAGIFPEIHAHGSRRGLRSNGPPGLRFVALFVADYTRKLKRPYKPDLTGIAFLIYSASTFSLSIWRTKE